MDGIFMPIELPNGFLNTVKLKESEAAKPAVQRRK
jgi:hypothetical protein